MKLKSTLLSTSLCLFFIGFITSCTKLDTTSIGLDAVPAVDNVHTFADTLALQTTQHFMPDSSTTLFATDNHVLGNITNDPLFGKTTADIYVNFKPAFYPYYFGNAGDTVKGYSNVGVDSIVLCLAYVGSWGDTVSNSVQTIQVSRVVDPTFNDSVLRHIGYAPSTGNVFATKTVDIKKMADTILVDNGKTKMVGQIRINIANRNFNADFLDELYNQDTAFAINAFKSDSLFRNFLNGFAIKAIGNANSLMYVNLASPKTGLEIHYRKRRNNIIDTTSSKFILYQYRTTNAYASGRVNHINRDRTGYPVATPDPTMNYLQTSPGTYINIKAPGLTGLTNRIVHRAYIEISQVPHNMYYDTLFSEPPYLYLDLKDTTLSSVTKWKPVYFDLNPNVYYNPDNAINYFPYGGIQFGSFGAQPRIKPGPGGNSTIKYYYINLTRYVQQIATKGTVNYDMRLWAPSMINYPQYGLEKITYNNPIALGRVRVGSGANSQYKMRLIIIYSKI